MSFRFTDPNTLGLAYDGIGILILGTAAILLRSASMAEEGSAQWDYNRYMIRARVEQKWDTCIGSIFLAAGFLFQFIAAIEYRFIPVAALALWIALPTLATLYGLLRRRIIALHTSRVVAIVAP